MADEKLTATAIKADVGSKGGHTEPSQEMMDFALDEMQKAIGNQVIDGRVTHTGDDICLFATHPHGDDAALIHDLFWKILDGAGDIAEAQGLYGAKQDLLADAPSGNVRGAGPGVAEITWDPSAAERPAEALTVLTADKCGPGVYNFLLGNTFANPAYTAGLMLPKMLPGFSFEVVNMEHTEGTSVITMDAKTRWAELAFLLRDENQFGIRRILHNGFPGQVVAAASTDRLHSIAGEYKGKDDPVAIVRTQGIFPAPEELVMPFTVAPFVAGDARGSHHMPLMPMPINSPVTGPYCLPIVSAVSFSVTKDGKLSAGMDMFDDLTWAAVRDKAQQKAMLMREQGWFGAAMLHYSELEYSAFRKLMESLGNEFVIEE